MAKLTLKELLELKGVRQIAFVQVVRGRAATDDHEFEAFFNSVD